PTPDASVGASGLINDFRIGLPTKATFPDNFSFSRSVLAVESKETAIRLAN
ncbi:hypothetical protein GW883_01985, partial [Candidatus Wolfebacteria bacterium]|nr:hypothetical protein [Candidatus Wolfebacteria bacterium]